MQHKTLYLTLLVIVLANVAFVYFFTNFTRYRKRFARSQKEKISAEITLLETERRRIADELNDKLSPLLTAIKLNTGNLEVQTKHDSALIERVHLYLEEISTSLRSLSNQLLPDTLQRYGLKPAITEFVENAKIPETIKIQVESETSLDIPKGKEIHIFRILQNLVSIAILFPGIIQMDIRLKQENGNLTITALQQQDVVEKEEVGSIELQLRLKSIENRCDILGATMVLEERPGWDTRYFITIPLRN